MAQIDDLSRLHHILDAAQEAVHFTNQKNRTDLYKDRILSLALIKLLEIVGEAASVVSEDLRRQFPEIAWRQMTAMRNRLIHGYFDIDYELVWDTITEELPPLIHQIKQVLEKEEQNEKDNTFLL